MNRKIIVILGITIASAVFLLGKGKDQSNAAHSVPNPKFTDAPREPPRPSSTPTPAATQSPVVQSTSTPAPTPDALITKSKPCTQPKRWILSDLDRSRIDPKLPRPFNYRDSSIEQLKSRALLGDVYAQSRYAARLQMKRTQGSNPVNTIKKEMAVFLGLAIQNKSSHSAQSLGFINANRYLRDKRHIVAWHVIARAMNHELYQNSNRGGFTLSLKEIDESLQLVPLLIALYGLEQVVDTQYIYFPSKWINDEDLNDLRITEDLHEGANLGDGNCLPERRVLEDVMTAEIENLYENVIRRENTYDEVLRTSFFYRAEELRIEYFEKLERAQAGEFSLKPLLNQLFYNMRIHFMLALKNGDVDAAHKLASIYSAETPYRDTHESAIWRHIAESRHKKSKTKESIKDAGKMTSAQWFAHMYNRLYGFY